MTTALATSTTNSTTNSTANSFIRPATVIGIAPLEVMTHRDGAPARLSASMAMSAPPALHWGDRVLVAVDAGDAFVIGVLERPHAPPAEATSTPRTSAPSDAFPLASPSEARRLSTECGASVTLSNDAITICDANERVIFNYRADTGQGTLTATHGLSLSAPEGDIELSAGGAIRCRGDQVALQTQRASLDLQPTSAELSAPRLAVSSGRADLLFGDARYRGEQLSAVVERAKIVTSKFERVAGWVIERARTVMRRVDDLDQLEAGRSRTLVAGAHTVSAGRASMTARDEVRIDGSSIHLG